MQATDDIQYALDGDCARVTLTRPEHRNALDEAAWQGLSDALDRAAEEARVAVIDGAGPAFCAGDDIQSLVDLETGEDGEALGELLARTLFGIEGLSIPVIAAVDGPAFGGGCELVAACDLAIATDESTFAIPETHLGAYPPYAAARPVAFGGKKVVTELALTGEPIDATRAATVGLVNQVVEADALEPAVEDLVERIQDAPETAVDLTKRRIRSGLRTQADEIEQTIEGFGRVATCPECRAAARAFFESD